ncbi:endoglucanase D precursor [Polyplosphaeria fusca]|uniref:Endoglucanase D n=1 Tax=Polyplosphaeria fusca TaxID=682080 RepID=A0A9P4RDR9_9PLEO|nr:endoglucanase D precursor [Polyplosphaeria fusca]
MPSRRPSPLLLLSTASLLLPHPALAAPNNTCTTPFTPLSASTFIAALNPGWNLGNTLDALPTEGSWNNPPVQPSTISAVRSAGYASVRIPVTYTEHFVSGSPNWDIDRQWLQRVSDVVDMVLAQNLSAIINVHHDSTSWADITAPSANISQIEERFYRLWYQVAGKLGCKGSKLGFEPINEIPGTTAEHGAQVNRMNEVFLQAVNDAGGWNGGRVVTLVGAGEDGGKTSMWFKRPDKKFGNPWGIQYHYYSPYDFIFSAWGKTIWGSDADKAALEADIAAVRGNFSDVPLVIGEWSASPTALESAARWRYFDHLIRTATKYNTSLMLWDNGNDYLDRNSLTWRDPIAQSILSTAIHGIPNALPDSTTDPSSPSQSSSAELYHRANSTIKDTSLSFALNANTLTSITHGTRTLTPNTDYTFSPTGTLTLLTPLLTSIFTPPTLGPRANLTLHFTPGTPLSLTLISFSPAPSSLNSTTLPLPPSGQDLLIPIPWSALGTSRPAAVKAVRGDGTYLVDDWTQWLGELQRGRMTYGGQWDWDGRGVLVKSGVVEMVRKEGKGVRFEVEFWPRGEGGRVGVEVGG